MRSALNSSFLPAYTFFGQCRKKRKNSQNSFISYFILLCTDKHFPFILALLGSSHVYLKAKNKAQDQPAPSLVFKSISFQAVKIKLQSIMHHRLFQVLYHNPLPDKVLKRHKLLLKKPLLPMNRSLLYQSCQHKRLCHLLC